ncbi:hypothetical protein GOP47_0026702 [Adiantum capillus-veneris]|nr:hypothetical protein GOP47_0026702 [Adiantum capillus-veneris]
MLLQWALLISKATCLSVDGVALISFKNSLTSDPYNALSDWNANDSTPCAWSGVACTTSPAPQGNTSRVVHLELIGKMLSGTISPALGALTSLQTLKLQGNFINGSLPVELFNATSLQILLLGGNRITGSLPSEIGNLINLRVFDISSNRMLGLIPESLTSCKQLQILVLARNLLSGPITDTFGTSFTSLEQLDLSSNLLSGSIPTDLGKLSALQGTLNLSYNHLSGSIPFSLGNLPYTVSLDLSHNNLSGRIPQDGSLAEQGPGPFQYNPGLCGFPLNIACTVTPFLSPLPSLPTEGSSPSILTPHGTTEINPSSITKKAGLSSGAITAIALGDAAAVSLFAILFVYLYWKARGCKEKDFTSWVVKDVKVPASKIRCFNLASTSEDSEASPGSEKEKEQGELVAFNKEFAFDIDELLRSSAYVLGNSGRGIVYKVVLGNGTPVVVRRVGEGGCKKRKDFQGEVNSIGKLRHPHIVRLLAYYWANDEKLLVYEFISHGSLATALQGHHPQNPLRPLTWDERLHIARGVARGLAYLHECSPRKYVHGDVKTTKILLDRGMHPYIADVGLARLAVFAGDADDMKESQNISSGSRSRICNNTVGWSGPQTGTSKACMARMYRAPEGDITPNVKLTQKWDVYGYGVVVMEMICGRERSLQMGVAGVDFVRWMRKGAAGKGGAAPVMVDPAIEAAAQSPSMAALLSLAVACTSPSPDDRPKMQAVAHNLDKLILHTRD